MNWTCPECNFTENEGANTVCSCGYILPESRSETAQNFSGVKVICSATALIYFYALISYIASLLGPYSNFEIFGILSAFPLVFGLMFLRYEKNSLAGITKNKIKINIAKLILYMTIALQILNFIVLDSNHDLPAIFNGVLMLLSMTVFNSFFCGNSRSILLGPK